MLVKPPYAIVVEANGGIQSRDQNIIVNLIDDLIIGTRMLELTSSMTTKELYALVEKHVDAAHDYYSSFTVEDMGKMLVTQMVIKGLAKKGGDTDEE